MTNLTSSLHLFNSFSLSVTAADMEIVTEPSELISAWEKAKKAGLPVLILGEGSNVLFLEDFAGSVLINRIKGIDIQETETSWELHIGAGENWHQLVAWTLSQGIPGLENLALIPGCVGSAPIQNIGAYGIELKNVCAYVDVLALDSGSVLRLSAEKCQFDYRESIFKHQYRNGFAIIAVGLSLKKAWQPVLTYGELSRLDEHSVTAGQIFDAVCAMRRAKLPDPAIEGNAGSFFKNPIISMHQADKLLELYPGAPHYLQPDGNVKLAAGWLIDKCGLKGYRIGGAAVHDRQALVLINQADAVSRDIIELAKYVRNQVAGKFGVWLEPEVRFISSMGEVDAVGVLS
ncbi:UDP-N-acetylmuramate dehydrogenase [Musicola paradisiaca]|uniref:UDP-N-acetylenolpyruvoylglucosamine reductase n=1 Tax=Musicola paradisiaca (strain Ech703) TaxID=579405 RepID=C6C4T9_MUSP7|nr:UDP-N-acetylmuramate dehydrogenase [Musicola paradisiaca]ACS87496.1 UDP-N-acetylenolpyruvoylglucosamine reductase [Musicola paradisiaca Ech703]